MLGETLRNISTLIQIDPSIIPNIITFIIVVGILFLSFKAQSWTILVALYPLSMGVLYLLGVDSVFNLITILDNWLGA